MSNTFIILEVSPLWRESVLWLLLIISLFLSGSWLVRSLLRGGPLQGAATISNRPGPVELIAILVSLSVLGLFFMWIFQGKLASEQMEVALAGSVSSLLSSLLVAGLLAWWNPQRFRSLGLAPSNFLKQLGYGLISALAVWPIATILILPGSLWIVRFLIKWGWGLDYTPQPHVLLRELSDTPTTLTVGLAIIMAVVIAPVTEELIFRGFLQGMLARLYRSRWAAILVSATIFSLFHLSFRANPAAGEVSLMHLERVPPLFFLGLALGYSYEKSRSLYRPIVIHMGFNGLAMIIVGLVGP